MQLRMGRWDYPATRYDWDRKRRTPTIPAKGGGGSECGNGRVEGLVWVEGVSPEQRLAGYGARVRCLQGEGNRALPVGGLPQVWELRVEVCIDRIEML